MSVVAEFTIPVEALPGGQTLVQMPDLRVEIENVIPTQESAFPFFWVWGDRPTEYVERVSDEPTIEDVELLERVEEGALFRSIWTPDADVIRAIEELDATIIEATGTADNWRFKVRTQEREAFNEFRTVFRRRGISIELLRLRDLAEIVEGERRSLTPKQRETLKAAYREGYFDIPRDVTQEELGEILDVSPRAVSDRLQRGLQNLVAAQLFPQDERR